MKMHYSLTHRRQRRILLELILLLLIESGICSVTKQTAWKPKSINGSIFNDPLFQNKAVATDCDLKCALIATKQRLPNVLYFDNEFCYMATVDFTNSQNVFIEGLSAVEGKWLYQYKGTIYRVPKK